MNDKILVKVILPELDVNFDMFIPVNEFIWKIKKLIIKSVFDLIGIPFDAKKDYILINKADGKIYDNNEIIINTDIRNATELFVVSIKK